MEEEEEVVVALKWTCNFGTSYFGLCSKCAQIDLDLVCSK